jgi:hypothetical protein
MPISYADDPYFCKLPRIDEQFGAGQQFSTKSELKLKIVDFYVQRNIKLKITNNNKSKLVMICKYFNYPWKIYFHAQHNGYLGDQNKSARALLF